MTSWEREAEEWSELARRQSLRVLVWGPGKPASDSTTDQERAYKKRCDIRNEVASVFEHSEVHFSEDPELARLTAGSKRMLRKEAQHAKWAHVILMLDVSRGVDLELDHFVPNYPWFRDKAYVFLPERYVGTTGLVSDVLRLLPQAQVVGFTEDDFSSCRIAKEMAVEIVDELANDRLLKTTGC